MARAGWIIAGALMAGGCGHRFPFGERLFPQSYGPPYGAALRDNQPHHPHNPAPSERHAEPDEAEARHYGSYALCRAALAQELGRRQGDAETADISAREAVGHVEAGGVVHEYRCVGATLGYRAWHRGGAHGPSEGEGAGGEEHHPA